MLYNMPGGTETKWDIAASGLCWWR